MTMREFDATNRADATSRRDGTGRESSEPATQKSSESTTIEVMDLQVALRRMNGKVNLVSELAEMFMEDIPQLLIDLKASAAANAMEELSRIAHSLKGLASNFEALHCVRAAARLEEAASENAGSDLTSLVEQLETEVHRLEACLREWLHS